MEKSIYTRHYGIVVEKVRSLREAAGLTQRELAQRLRKAQTTIARMEQGQRRIDLVEFYAICRALKVDPKREAGEVLDRCAALDRARVR